MSLSDKRSRVVRTSQASSLAIEEARDVRSALTTDFCDRAKVYLGIAAKMMPFHNETNRVVYLFWASDKNSQQTRKSNVNAGADGAGFGYKRELERKDVHTGELMICPGQTSTIEMPTSAIFVTISSESGSYTEMPPCIFINRMFTAHNCKGYTIREAKFASHGIGRTPRKRGQRRGNREDGPAPKGYQEGVLQLPKPGEACMVQGPEERTFFTMTIIIMILDALVTHIVPIFCTLCSLYLICYS
jgi:hypothetical protein